MEANQPIMQTPNLYELSGKHLHITYSTSGIDGKPHFSYQDLHQTLSFSDDQIRVAETEIGILVSVTIRMTIDTGGGTFSVLLPHVNIPGEQSMPVQTLGITTLHKFSILPVKGQRDFYTPVHLHGSASLVFF
jgi:hypothetical protein